MNHAIYGFIAGFNWRKRLASLLQSSPRDMATHCLCPENLKEGGVTVLALDFDGVLAPHGRTEPLPQTVEWLSRCSSIFGEDHIYILSNKPTAERRQWFSSHFPGIRFISGVRKKPYPDGLLKVIEQSEAMPEEVMLLDDRLLTGVLATCLAGTRVTYINKPYTDLRANPVHEIFFSALRLIERILIGCVPVNEYERRNK